MLLFGYMGDSTTQNYPHSHLGRISRAAIPTSRPLRYKHGTPVLAHPFLTYQQLYQPFFQPFHVDALQDSVPRIIIVCPDMAFLPCLISFDSINTSVLADTEFHQQIRFNKIMKRLNMTHKPHDTRHSFITLAKTAGVNEYILKLIVGHAVEDITEKIYTHRSIEDLHREIQKIK